MKPWSFWNGFQDAARTTISMQKHTCHSSLNLHKPEMFINPFGPFIKTFGFWLKQVIEPDTCNICLKLNLKESQAVQDI